MKKKLLIAIDIFDKNNLGLLADASQYGLEVIRNPTGSELDYKQHSGLFSQVDYIIAGLEQYDRNFFSNFKNIKCISRVGVGVDSIDVDAAKEFSVPIYITSDQPSVSVAELCISNMIALLRSSFKMSESLKMSKWTQIQGRDLRNCTVGIVGFGAIGKQVAKRLQPFGCKILGTGRTWDTASASKYGVERSELKSLFEKSNIVTVHLPLTKETQGVITRGLIQLMPKDSILVNTSRSGVVDNHAVRDAILEKKLVGAAIDVFSEHRKISPYEDLENVILTPHIGSHTIETRRAMEQMAFENILSHIKLEELEKNDGEITDLINRIGNNRFRG